MSLVYIKVQRRESPYHQVFRGFRILVAHPNLCGRSKDDNELRPSFLPPYLIHATGDLPRVTPIVFHQTIAKLQQRYHFRSFMLWSELEPEPFFKRR